MIISTIIHQLSITLISFEESHHFVNPGVKVGLVGKKEVSFTEGSRQESLSYQSLDLGSFHLLKESFQLLARGVTEFKSGHFHP
jgi:hypothetical protein